MQWQMTEWYNPSKSTVELRIFVQPGNVQVYKIPPKSTALISEEYDEAIRAMRDGRVVGGLCPWLLKASERPDVPSAEPATAPVIASALVPEDPQAPAASAPAAPPATVPEKPARDTRDTRGK